MRIIFLILLFICAGSITELKAGLKTVGFATYYTAESSKREGTSGILTASGKRYEESAMTCALPSLPAKVKGKRLWGQKWRIINLQTQKQIVVRQTDLGPGRKARSRGVICDLTPTAFLALGGNLRDGRIRVKIEEVK